jgi:glutaredoxin 3
MAEVIVYTTEPCSYCSRVKMLLSKRGIAYKEINLARDADGRSALAERTGMLSFPQVVVDGELIGGFDQTVAADRAGRLAALAA